MMSDGLQTALFEPRGLSGLLYWYFVMAFHGVVFRTLLAGIHRDAVQIAAEPDKSHGNRTGVRGH